MGKGTRGIVIGFFAFFACLMICKSDVRAIDFSDSRYDEAELAILNAWETRQEVIDVEDMGLTRDVITDFYQWMVCRYPEYFYVGKQFGMTVRSSSSGASLLTLELEYRYSASKTAAMQKKLNRVIKKILSGVDSGWSDLDKALYIHEYLCLNCEYDTALTRATMYDCLVSKKAMCQGYALTYQYLLEQLDIHCECVKSDSINHMWNLVRIGKKYYMVDVTWDDPVKERIGRAKHIFFLKSISYFQNDGKHLGSDWEVFGEVSAAKATATTYDSCFWNRIDTPFCRIGGAWYTFDGKTAAVTKYAVKSNKLKKSKKIKTVSDVWRAWSDAKSYYRDSYVNVAAYKEKLYYTTPEAVYYLNVKNGKTKKIYSLTAAQKKKGYIYAMAITSTGKLKLLLGTSINTPVKTITAKSL